MKKINWYVMVILVLAGVLALAQVSMLAFTNADRTDILYVGNIETFFNGDAVLIRDEKVIKIPEKDFIAPAIESGTKVAKGELVARSCDQSSVDILSRYEKAQQKLNAEIRKTVLPVATNDFEIIKLNKVINEKLMEMMLVDTSATLRTASALERDIRSLTDEKIKIVLGTLPKESPLIALKKEVDALNQRFYASSGAIKATTAGVVSFVVDGYESQFKLQDYAKIQWKDLEGVKNQDQLTEKSSPKNSLKLIQNFYAYLAVNVDADFAENIALNTIRKIRINDVSETIDGELVLKNNGSNHKTLLLFKIDQGIEKTCDLRKVNIDIAKARSVEDGFKIPKESLLNPNYENMMAQIALVRKHKIEFRKVEILDFDATYAIVRDATPDLTGALQLYEEYLKNPSKVKEGDLLK
ncbi:MAG: HlyD family efflux transporter periplasmic adaptor subunit [Clostridia bacterium]